MSAQRRSLQRALSQIETRLRGRPASIELKFERAQLLDRLGRTDEARLGFVDVLQRDPNHFGALNDLGMLLFKAGAPGDALICYNAAVAKHPNNAIGRANLAFMLLRGGEAEKAREQYEIALRLDPKNSEAHRGLALALTALGDESGAQAHSQTGFKAQPVMVLPYRGEGRPVRVLLVVSASAGNLHAENFLDDRVFQTIKVVAEYADATTSLPAHDIAFNAVADADVALRGIDAARAILERSGAPVVNRPEAVRETGRVTNAERLARLPGVVTAKTVQIERARLLDGDAAGVLREHGLELPVLLRSPGFHTGKHFELIESPEQIAEVAARLPGEELLAMGYLDVRNDDGAVRKYRVMFVDGRLYPLHLAVASQWKVHYFSAEMAEHAERRHEDRIFLSSIGETLGAPAAAALERIFETLALDYAGIDFGIDRAGNVAVFEANATMIVPKPDDDPRFAYRREPIEAIYGAVRSMLLARAGAAASS